MARSILSRDFGVDRAGQAKFRVVGDFERVIVILRLDHGQQRAENFFLLQARLGRDIRDDRGLQEVSFAGILRGTAAGDDASIFFPTSM